MPDYWGRARKQLKQKGQKGIEKERIEEWQKFWREAGPIRFAEELLTCPLDVPIHPDFVQRLNPTIHHEHGFCPIGKDHPKFRENGVPYHIILSEEQKYFLTDIWINGVRMALVAAARGAGKTFVFGIYDCWEIAVNDKIKITCMGGSSKQSEIIQDYIDDWRIDAPMLNTIIYKSLRGIKMYCKTLGRSVCMFPACSPTSARGQHVNIVEIDEACVPPNTKIIAYPERSDSLDGNPEFIPIEHANFVVTSEGNCGIVRHHTQRIYHGDLFHIIPYFNNIGVKVTPNHKIKVIKRRPNYYYWNDRLFLERPEYAIKRKSMWVEAKDLIEGDILVSPVPKRFVNRRLHLSNARLKLIGYYISEGSTGDHQIYYSNKEPSIIDDFVHCIKQEFRITPGVTTLPDGTKNVYFTNHEFRKWLLDHCGHLSENKHIPHEYMGLEDNQLDVLLNAIMRGDGEDGILRKRLHVKSEKLAQQFWFIYASRSILTTIERDKRGYFSWNLWKKQKSRRCYGKIINGVFYVPIRELHVEPYDGIVCNLEVDWDPSYTVPYISLHNCVAEDKSEDGSKAVAAVQWQTTGKRDTKVLLASTAHYIHGMFYEYMTRAEFGFKTYFWSIARHISGEKDPYKIYADKDPKHWKPNVWWLTQTEIEDKRRSKSDEEWLCECLGGASMASGAVFKKDDLKVVLCELCDNCEPYKWGKCKLVEIGELGIENDPTKFIIERMTGFDYGTSEAPCALTIVGRKVNVVFVLFNDEQRGLREAEKLSWINDNCKQFQSWTIVPDPAEGGKHLNQKLEDMDYAVYTIAENEKISRVFNVISHVEKKKIIVPKAFWYLTQSLKKLAWDKENKIRKIDDHSFDSLCYSMVDYRIDEGEFSIFTDLINERKKPPRTDDVYGITG